MRVHLHHIISIIACVPAIAVSAQTKVKTLDDVIERLQDIARYEGTAQYSVTLPSAADDIVYSVDVQSLRDANDSLSPCYYLIEWTLPTPSGESSGFGAYFHGSHFNLRDGRLQEYHYDWDSIPFVQGGGVQRNAQFTDLLPQYMAERLRSIRDDADCDWHFTADTVSRGRHVAMLEAVMSVNGYVGSEMTYVFDPTTAMPLKVVTEYNPGAISEQTVEVEYGAPRVPTLDVYTEDALMTRHPEAFERMRQSNFRVENLPGTELPPFALPTLTGERYSRVRGEDFATPMIVVLLDPTVATARQTIDDVRSTVSMLPFNMGVIWAFVSNDHDAIEELVGAARVGETVLTSARALARDCGVVSYPTLLFVKRSGKVADVQLGYNKILEEIVMEKSMKTI